MRTVNVTPRTKPVPEFGIKAEDMKLTGNGKVKDVWELGDGRVQFVFTDEISVFDKKVPNLIQNKGETLARTSSYFFKLAKRLGINTHFLGQPAPNAMTVLGVKVDANMQGVNVPGYLIPLEWIRRYQVEGSLNDRIKNGKITDEELVRMGFEKGYRPRLHQTIPNPVYECTTKLEATDKLLTEAQALEVGHITTDMYHDIWDLIQKYDQGMHQELAERGVIHADGKIEVAIDMNGRPMLVDTVTTADEDRFYLQEDVDQGRWIEQTKEVVRQHYRQTPITLTIFDLLQMIRDKREPDLPPMPEAKAQWVSGVYIRTFERLTGEPFRPREVAPDTTEAAATA